MGPKETKKAFALVEATTKGPADDESSVSAIIAHGMSTLERNFPLNIAMNLSTDPDKLRQLIE